MTKKLFDISKKIDNYRSEIILFLNNVCSFLDIPFFIVGATARDITLEYIYEIRNYRATNDIDFGIRINNWNKFDILRTEILKNSRFSKDERIEHRLLYDEVYPIDVIPFGEIATTEGKFVWPQGKNEFTVLGFEEAYNNSLSVKIRNNPEVFVHFATTASLCVLKLISWFERYPERTRDAIDITYLIEFYLDTGNQERLNDEESDLIDENFDYIFTGAKLLGRDIASNFQKETLKLLEKILDEETADNSKYRLIEDMMKSRTIREEKDFDYYLKLLQNIILGLRDKNNNHY